MSVTTASPRADLERDLTTLARIAHRLPYVTRKFTTDPLTPWDKAHAELNDLLSLREALL